MVMLPIAILLRKVNIKESKCVIVAIPDRAAQEELVTQIQTIFAAGQKSLLELILIVMLPACVF